MGWKWGSFARDTYTYLICTWKCPPPSRGKKTPLQYERLGLFSGMYNSTWKMYMLHVHVASNTHAHFMSSSLYAFKAQTSLAPLSRFRGSRVTTAHAHQCCTFQSYAKTVPSRMKLTMKLTMRKPTFMGSMTTDTWSRRVTSDFKSVLRSLSWVCRTLNLANRDKKY